MGLQPRTLIYWREYEIAALESFIVRVYRRKAGEHQISGLVERVATGASKPFQTFEQLWMFLVESSPGALRPERKRNVGKR